MPKSSNLPPLEWDGFEAPAYTQVPDALFDRLLPYLSDAELRVLLYLIRRTFGFKKQADAVSLSQIVNGIPKGDGTYQDYGAGLSKNAACVAIKKLETRGIIIAERRSSATHGHETTTYSVRMRGTPLSSKMTTLVIEKDKGSHRGGQALVIENDIQDTDSQDTDSDSNPPAPPKKQARRKPADTPVSAPPPYSGLHSAYIAGVIQDHSAELGDSPHWPANVTQAHRLWQASDLAEADFVAVLHEAKRRVRLYQGKQGAGRITNKIGYYFAVVADLAGLVPATAASSVATAPRIGL